MPADPLVVPGAPGVPGAETPGQPAWTRPKERKEVVTAAVCRDCPWHRNDRSAVEYAYEHAHKTGHRVSAEHRERLLWDWERSDG